MEAEKVELVGVPNFWKVADGLYRSGRPTPEGWKNLYSWGLKTAIDLEYFYRVDGCPDGVCSISIPTVAWWAEEEDVIKFLEVLKTAERPILWHCLQGSDRTGYMTAFERIILEGWGRIQAINEMLRPEFGFHEVFENLIRAVACAKVERIKGALNEHDWEIPFKPTQKH